jgi:hypothetical protein
VTEFAHLSVSRPRRWLPPRDIHDRRWRFDFTDTHLLRSDSPMASRCSHYVLAQTGRNGSPRKVHCRCDRGWRSTRRASVALLTHQQPIGPGWTSEGDSAPQATSSRRSMTWEGWPRGRPTRTACRPASSTSWWSRSASTAAAVAGGKAGRPAASRPRLSGFARRRPCRVDRGGCLGHVHPGRQECLQDDPAHRPVAGEPAQRVADGIDPRLGPELHDAWEGLGVPDCRAHPDQHGQRRIRVISGSTTGSVTTVAGMRRPKYSISTAVPGTALAGSHA